MAKRINLPYSLSPAVRTALDNGDVFGLLEVQRARFGDTRMDGEGGAGGSGGAGAGGGAGQGGAAGAAGGGAGDGGSGAGGQGGAGQNEPGFPANTPIVEMTTEQQAAYWKHQARKHEDNYKALGNVDELKQKAAAHDKVVQDNQSEHERNLEAARQEAADNARAEERAKNAGELVKAHVTAGAAAKGIKPEEIGKAVDFLDATKFLAADGTVDSNKVAEFVTTLTPATGTNGRGPDTGGQGRRDNSVESSVKSGRDRFAERHGKQQQTATA